MPNYRVCFTAGRQPTSNN